MLSGNIKAKLTVTLVLLLAIGMILTSFVMFALWQRQDLQNEIEELTLLVESISGSLDIEQDFGASSLLLPIPFKKVLHEKSITCFLIAKEEEHREFLSPCKKDSGLEQVLLSASRSGTVAHIYSRPSIEGLLLGNNSLLMAIPVHQDQKLIAVFGLSKDLAPLYKQLRSALKVVFIYILVNVVILAAIGFFRFSNLLLRPLNRLVTLADSGSGRDGMMLFESDDGDEFAKLTRSLNRMIKRIAADNEKLRSSVQSLEKANKKLERNRQEMVRVEKLAAVGRLSAGLAHEIGNPLGIIQGYTGMLGHDGGTDEEKKEYLARIESELGRINDLMQQLLGYSRFSDKQSQIFSVHEVLLDVIDLVRFRGQSKTVCFVERFEAENDLITANSDNLKQVFINCFFNSIDAIQEKKERGEIVVETQNKKNDSGESILTVTITDNGNGIEAENIDKIFDPFFTTKDVGHGTGLGLFVSHTILDNLGGRMRAESKPGKGTRIIVDLKIRKEKDG